MALLPGYGPACETGLNGMIAIIGKQAIEGRTAPGEF